MLRVFIIHRGLRVEEQHQVDVRRVVQLPRAEFAQGQDGKAGVAFRLFRVGQGDLTGLVQTEQQVPGGGAAGGLREVREGAGDFGQAPEAADVGNGDGQGGAAFGFAQLGGKLAAAGGERQGAQFVQRGGQGGVGSGAQRLHQAVRLAAGEISQVRCVAAQAVQRRAARGSGSKAALGGAEGSKILAQARGGGWISGRGKLWVVGHGVHLASRTR